MYSNTLGTKIMFIYEKTEYNFRNRLNEFISNPDIIEFDIKYNFHHEYSNGSAYTAVIVYKTKTV